MENDDRNERIRTTLYLPRHLHESAKLMAIMTRSNLSRIMCIALREKLESLKKKDDK